MHIKKYVAMTMKEAIDLVKQDLGPSAVILSTRTTNEGNGVFGLLGKKLVEVTAALDRDVAASGKNGGQEKVVVHESLGMAKALSTLMEEISHIRAKLNEPIASFHERDAGMDELRYLARYLKSKLSSDPKLPIKPKWISIYQRMIEQGVEPRYAKSIVSRLSNVLSGKGAPESPTPLQACANLIGQAAKVSGPLKHENGKPAIAALMGPTGVGKTTTVAKLAAHYAVTEKKSVALVTLDTRRIGAAEQLKIYAQIIDSPIEVVLSPAKLHAVLNKFATYHIILIDTAGLSQNNAEQIAELRHIFKQDIPIETHLVLSATTKNADLEAVISKFGAIGFDRLIFTKLDESSTCGCILNQALKTLKPLSYLTFGQRVPEDIEAADGKLIGELVLGLRTVGKNDAQPSSDEPLEARA